MEFLDFWVFGLKFTKFLNLKVKQQVSFSLNFASFFNVMRDNSSVLFSWNFTWFLQKQPIKVQYFRLLTAQVKFHQICTLIDTFCLQYIKFQLKTYRGVTYISWYWRVMQNLKKNRFFVSKMTRIWSISTLIGHYNVWSKIKEKLTCGSENDQRKVANFHQNTLQIKCKIQNVWTKNF